MTSSQTIPEVKRIGETGQVSVGKSLAGKLVRVEPSPDGIMLRFVVDVPEKDAWWLQEPWKSKLQDALSWAAKHPAQETDLDALLARAKPPTEPGRAKAPRTKQTKRGLTK